MADGRKLTKAEPEGRGNLAELVDQGREERSRSHGGAAGSTDQVGVQDSEAGGRDKGSSSDIANGDWQIHSTDVG